MADRPGREGSTRRPSFRRALADHAESGLPSEYLDELEQKRKQLDESIHKYIAAKEREYKTWERDLRQQYRLAQEKEGARPPREGAAETETGRHDTDGGESSRIHVAGKQQQQQQQSVVDTLLAAGLRRDQIGQPVAVAVALVDDNDNDNDTDTDNANAKAKASANDHPPTLETRSVAGLTAGRRGASVERDKELVGVFMPAFLPALDDKARHPISDRSSSDTSSSQRTRTSSAPPQRTPDRTQDIPDDRDIRRADSEPVVGAKLRRPTELQLVQRNSSSASSQEGRLMSAMKSPTHPQRSKRKRVSLAVGDFIVAPSDNVPLEMGSNNSTPSHSRTRSPAPDRAEPPLTLSVERTRTDPASLPPPLLEPASSSIPNDKAIEQIRTASATRVLSPAVQSIPPPTTSPPRLDPDGDLFDLDEDDGPPIPAADDDLFGSGDEMAGRVHRDPAAALYNELDDPNHGLIQESDEPDDHAEHVEFVPGSAVASQQPTNPGFRRPSATFDPVYRGANYQSAEQNAVVNDIYGSSYTRPNKGSFTAGSLGESFMAQNAERMRERVTREQPQVRS
ncbi:Hypothetical predicted protein [Lecanosticta acicola]|uniref:Uncharacterized protein n=1 Tax=Lecanosticta acicola TaxID=111012 RepID=A0AAI9E8L9_9PEZI|nr:Hypothetical predicted protein [Lecanosticta acicola]